MPFLKDLSPDEEMAPTVGLLFSAVNENIERLKSIVSGISREERNIRVSMATKTASPS